MIVAGLCQEKNALHKPTLEGCAPAHKLWESTRKRDLPLREVLDIRECHRLAPFCFYTFAAIGRTLIQDLLKTIPPANAHTFRSVVGHYIAGTAGAEELSKALDELN
jgi:hypothetical protein